MDQADFGIEVAVSAGDQVNTYCSAESLKALGALRGTRSAPYVLPQARPAVPADRGDDVWKQMNQITVRTQDHVALLSGTAYGLRTCALACIYLATSDQPALTDHYHWDHYWLGTSNSVEFILRNTDRG